MIYNLTKFNAAWNTRKLHSLGEFARGKSKHRPRNDGALYEGGGYPFIQTGDIKAADLYITSHDQEYNEVGLAQSKLWDSGTLAITIAANIAETAILSYPMCFPDSVVGFTAYPSETTEMYMHYIFAYIRASIQRSVGGSIQDNINIDYLENLDFKIPDKTIQDKMVEILATIDRKIAINNALTIELEKSAKLIYDYWFTQFDFPDANGQPYRVSGGAMEYNAQLKREIPKGWIVKPLGEQLDISRGSIITEKETEVGKVKVVAAGVTFSYYHSTANRPNNTITVSSSGANAGYLNFWQEEIYASDCITVRGEKDIDTLIAYQFLKSMQAVLMKKSTGSAQPHVYPNDIEALQMCVIPDPLKERISGFMLKINKKIQNNNRQTDELTALRDFLLPLLMNGQVTVKPQEARR